MGRIRSNIAIAKMIGIMTVSFYVCWTPFAVKCILAIQQIQLTAVVAGLALLLAKLGVIINPLIYIFNNNDVRPKIRRY